MHLLCSSAFIALNQQEHTDKIDKASKTVHAIKIKDQYNFYFIEYPKFTKEIADFRFLFFDRILFLFWLWFRNFPLSPWIL